ncbi:hypothetical protein KP509_37G028800 [Ceratopteris richardii]|uniref:C2H2-type domain-containing protein n=1 Tax=Ceratopteris richardii TaxID=49495 RepID=A0A8T2Q7P7_CERRI|nr:hypothetical protein KP509_37G028800 [Ceratopteris richardii]
MQKQGLRSVSNAPYSSVSDLQSSSISSFTPHRTACVSLSLMALNLQHGDLYSPSRYTQPSATPEHHACDFCPRFFRSSDGLKQHLRSSHLTTDSSCSSPQTVSETLTNEERLDIKYVACNDCGRPFKEMDALHQHQWDCADHVRVSATPKPNKGTFERKCSLCESRFASAKDLEQHFVKNHPLIELKRREHDCGKWDEVEARFRTAWKKPQVHLYEVHRIFKVYNPGWRRHGDENYRKELKRQMSVTAMVKEMKEDPDLKNTISRDGNELRRYHGTAVKCQLGRPLLPSRTWGTVDENLLQAHSLCTDDACSLCRIIENGFMRSKCRTGRYQRYGKGIYTSQCSSKASNYVRCGVTTRGQEPPPPLYFYLGLFGACMVCRPAPNYAQL